MDEQLLKDLVATSEAYDYDWKTILPKFPELSNYDTQLLKDYVATTEANNYDYNLVNSKFPEFNFETKVETEVDTEPEKELVAEIVPEPEEADSLKISKAKDFDKGIFKMAEREAYDKYKETGEVDISLIPKDSDDPNIIQDYLSGPLKFTAGLFKGVGDFKNMSNMLLMDAGLRIFSDVNDEQRQALVAAEGRKGDIQNFVWGEIEKSLDKYQKKYENESFLDDWEQGNKGLAVERAVGAAIESIPTTLAAFTGLGGIIALGGSFAGSKFREEYTKDPSRSIYRLAGNALLSGGTESAFEGVTRYLGGKIGLIAVKKGGQAAKEFTKTSIEKFLTNFGLVPVGESASEAATRITTDIIDKITLGEGFDWKNPSTWVEDWRKTFKGSLEEGIIGGISGGGFGTVAQFKNNNQQTKEAATLRLMPESDKKTLSDAAVNINNLNDQIRKSNNNQDIETLEKEISNQEQVILNTKNKVSEELNMMSPEELRVYASNIDKINEVRKKLNSRSQEYLEKIPFVKKVSVQELLDLQIENEALIRESVDRRLDENIKTVGVKDLGRTVNDYDTKEDYQKAYDNTEIGKKNSMNVTSSDGFIDTEGDIYINREVAQKVRNVNVAAHELLHGILNNNIKEPAQLKRLVNEFKAILPKETADLIQKRIDDNYRFETNEKGERVEVPESEYMEEYFTAFADLIGNKKVKFNENIFTKIGDKLTPIFKGKGYGHIKFETGKDVYDFIKNYQKQIAKGELAPETIEAAKKVTDQDTKTEFSKTEDNKTIKEIFDKFTGPAENRKFKSKEEFKNSPEFFDALLEIEQSNTLDASIRNTVSEAYLDMNPEFVKEVKERISDKYRSEYDASKNSLFGWLTGKNKAGQTIIQLAAGDIQIKRSKKPSTVTTTKKIGGEDSKVTVAETLVSDEISPEEYADIQLAKEKLEKIEPQQSAIANKIKLTENELNLAKREIINFLRKTDRPAMTDPKKFFKALVDYTTGKSVQPGGFANVIYNKLSLPKNGELSTKNRESFIRKIAEDLIALNKVDPSVMRRSKWTPFYELEIKNMNPTQMQKAIDEGRIPSTSNLKSGLDLFKTLDPSVDQVTEYLMNIRPDVLKRKMPKFLAEVIIKNEFNDIVDNTTQPVYDTKGNVTDNTIDLSETVTEQEVKRGAPQVREKIARPEGVKFSKSVEKIINIRNLFELETKGIDKLLKSYGINETFNLKTEQGIKDFIVALKSDLLPLMPKEFWFGKKTVLTPSYYIIGSSQKNLQLKQKYKDLYNNIYVPAINEIRNDANQKYGKPIKGIKDYSIAAYSTIFKNSKTIEDNLKNGKIKNWNKKVELIHREMWSRFNKSISKNKKTASVIGNYLKFTGSATSHWHKLGAQFVGYSKNVTGSRFEYEHAMPATSAYLYLIDAALSENDFATTYDLTMNNYKLIALDKAMDKKLTAAGLQRKMPENWSVIDNFWWQRYFNNKVAKQNGGVNPSSIIGLDGKSFSEIFNIDANGNSTNSTVQNLKDKAKLINEKDLSNSVVSFSKSTTNEDVIGYAKTVDEALAIARDPNAPVKKIRVFDFDDTLARSKSLVFYNRPNESSKPVPSNKAIFMIGGPGSGKTNIGKGLQLGRDGFKVVNQDIYIESEKTKRGLPEAEKDYTAEQRSLRSKIGAEGRKAAQAKMDKYAKAGNGMVIDGTGASYNATMKKVNALKKQGYEVFMVYGKTSKEVALGRNRNRKERSLKDFIVEKTHDAVVGNIDQYKKELGDNFVEIDTETIEYGKPLPSDFVSAVKSKLYATERGRLNAEEFASQGSQLVDEGFAMDFSDFNIVREGERGPLFDIAKKIEKARGTEDVFVLTARAPESQQAIHEFLKSEGLNIPIENITGLGNSTGAAKASWIVDKAADGYNDFYFADDAVQNVKAVQDALSQLDVKSKVQQAKVKFSKNVNQDFNKIIEQTTGIASEKEYSKAKAKVRGAGKGNKKFFIPYSAEDFMGLIYPLLSKGKLGDSQMAWFKQNLLDPYARAIENLSTDRLQLMEDFKALKKALEVPKNLRKKNDSGFTNEQAVRVYLFNRMGYDVPGLSKTDLQELIDAVNSDGLLKAFADQLMNVTKGDGYAKPGQSWLAGTITTDLIDVLNTVKRKKYLEQSGFLENADLIFSETNLNKLEAAYGEKYREAMENILKRMKSGKNRLFSGNRLSNRVLDYINGSIGAIMFFNARSAVLQTISAANFINWSFNNPIKAGKAFANQKQYWSDFKELMNSDYLMDRRNGLKLNISESEIADAAATSKNKAKAAISYILQKGFLPTQFADSFAIASGGATFYRNRINDLIKNEGLTEAEAKKKAMLEFRQVAEQSQQSSDPSKISAQQSSDLGRVILAFANTPMQYARLQKRAIQDLINKRGDAKSHVSKLIYYGAVQNIIFNALQQGLFALGFGDDEEDEAKNKRYYKVANGMLDSQLRGLGIAGATVGVVKNFLLDVYERSDRKRPEYVDAVYKLLQISPPISSKISKVRQAAYQFDSKKRREEIFEKGFSLDNPAYEASAKVISATTNIPLDRLYSKVNNIEAALAEDAEVWQSIAMLAGWPEWQIKPDKKDVTVGAGKNLKIKQENLKQPIKKLKEVKKL